MRLILTAVALAALSLPAHAQRLNTTRVNIEVRGDTAVCGFAGYPGLTLGHNRVQKIATWVQAPEGAAHGDHTRMTLNFMPTKNWRRPQIMMLSVRGRSDASLGSVTRGRLSIDGGAPVPMSFNGRDDAFLMIAGHNAEEAVYSMIDNSKLAEVDLLDENGAVVRSYSWDTSRLSDAVETVSVVGWSCTSP